MTKSISCLLLVALLVVASMPDDSFAGRRARRCRRVYCYYQPCRPSACCCPCAPSCVVKAPQARFCPYYNMGGFWYGERFDWDDEAQPPDLLDCQDGYPTGAPYVGPKYCTEPNCGNCYPLTGFRICPSNHYLKDRIPWDLEYPPGYDPDDPNQPAKKVSGPHHVRIVTIDGVSTQPWVNVAYWHMRIPKSETPGKPIDFWIGYESTAPPHPGGRKAHAISDPSLNAVVRIHSGGSDAAANAKDMLVQLTGDHCMP